MEKRRLGGEAKKEVGWEGKRGGEGWKWGRVGG